MLVFSTSYDPVTTTLTGFAIDLAANVGGVHHDQVGVSAALTALSVAPTLPVVFYGHGRADPAPAGFVAQNRQVWAYSPELSGRTLVGICCHGETVGPTLLSTGGAFLGFEGKLYVPLVAGQQDGMKAAITDSVSQMANGGTLQKAEAALRRELRVFAQRLQRSNDYADKFGALFAGLNADAVRRWS